ncbi:hypothetical protein EON79_19315 [bacterium]|nr:MAG: hypothetical protein EON79_19315 [bacterium]
MISRALKTLVACTLAGIALGGLIGWGIGTVAPFTYINRMFGAAGPIEAQQMGLGFGIINGSILGVVVGGLVLLYDLGSRFLALRESTPHPARNDDSQ